MNFMGAQVPSKVKALYAQKIQKQQDEIMHGFFSLLGISYTEWTTFKKACMAAYLEKEKQDLANIEARCTKSVSSELKSKIETLLKNSQIDRPIAIVRDYSPEHADIQTTHNAIIISEEAFNSWHQTDEQKEATILHEIQHLIWQDAFTAFCLNELKDRCLGMDKSSGTKSWMQQAWSMIRTTFKKFNADSWNSLIKKWQHFREWRADILGSLTNTKYIKARIDFWQHFIKVAVETEANEDHPSAQSRLQEMEEMLQLVQSS
jgi:hypothetical protein